MILHITSNFNKNSGQTYYVRRLVKFQKNKYNNVKIFFYSNKYIYNILFMRVNEILLVCKIIINNSNLKIYIHGFWRPIMWPIFLTIMLSHREYWIFPHGSLEPGALKKGGLKKTVALMFFLKYFFIKSKGFLVCSEKERNSVLHLFPNLPAKFVGVGIDRPPNLFRLKSIFNREVVGGNLLFIGRIEESKGIEVLLESWATVRKNNWSLILAGPCDSRYKNFLLRKWPLLLNESVVFCGAINNPQREELFNKASGLVLPSFSENFGFVVAEALIRGVPVVTTDQTPWAADRINSGCLISKAGDANDLAKVLDQLMLLTPQQISSIGILGSKYALEKFSWDNVVARIANNE